MSADQALGFAEVHDRDQHRAVVAARLGRFAGDGRQDCAVHGDINGLRVAA